MTAMKGEKRKRNQRPIPYDHELAFPALLEQENIDEALEADRGNRGDVYATKEIRSGEQLEVEIYPEFGRGQQNLIPSAAREKQRKAQKNLNDRNSRKQCERVINHNFGDGDVWATFTYDQDNVPASMDDAQRDMQNFIRRVNRRRKKQGLPNAKYVYVTEQSPSGRWHHHIVMDGGLDMDTLEGLWKLGRRNQVRRLSKDENGLSGMANYLTKGPRDKKPGAKGQKSWVASKGLEQPDERVNHYKFKRKHVREMARDENVVRAMMEKWYAPEGYIYTSSQVRYNEVNGRFYIYARLRRPVVKGRKGKGCGSE